MSNFTELLRKKNLSVGIFGIGESNLGVIEYLTHQNSNVIITVRSDTAIGGIPFKNTNRIFVGEHSLGNIDEDILFLSPSVRRDRPEIISAQRRGTLILSDADLFFEKCSTAPVVVTGSDGKSSTTHLISQAFSLSDKQALPCGNYGKSLCSLLDKNILPIAELSSFQLNYLKPHSSYAVITNITPNHLNWHTSLDEYVRAKMNITEKADNVIFDADSEIASKNLADRTVFCKTSLFKSYTEMKHLGGCENYITYDNGFILLNGSPIIDVSRAKRKEHYNIRNFMLTAAACINECKTAAISEAITSFSGLEHRAEVVRECNGIKYIDSSIDSSPERTLKTLSALDEKPIVILGGKGKGLSVDSLATALPRLTRGAVLLGEVGLNIYDLLKEENAYSFLIASDMSDAVEKAIFLSGGSGTIILSPAATSFDSYKNFQERGDDFKRIIRSFKT